MEKTVSVCNSAAIQSLLDGRLDQRQSELLEAHLEACPACRAKLDEIAAEPAEWDELRQHLSTDEDSDAPLDARGSSARGDHSALEILKYLAPTDDPQMVGRLAGYEIVGVIGSGGMGVVLKGFDRSLNRFVAIKVLSPALAQSAVARRRFSREAQAAAAVVHDNVVAIHGVSEASGLPFLVMPYVRGQSLARRIEERGMLSPLELLRVAHQVASGLAAAHAQGLVHRDIKPANILLEDGVERLKITDFGLARSIDDVSITQTGVIAGTPQFMSPEQSRGAQIDHRSDLFSLGSLMYVMATGCPPFRGDTALCVLERISQDEPVSIRRLNSEIPAWLEEIVRKLHCKSPDERFQSAKELADHLELCLAHLQQPLVAPAPPRLPVAMPSGPADKRTARRVVLALLIGLALALTWAGVLKMQTADESPARLADTASADVQAAPPSLMYQKLPLSIPQLPEHVRNFSFSQDGKHLAVGHSNHRGAIDPGSGSVYIWDLPQNKVRATFHELHGISSVSLTSDGSRVAYGTFEKLFKVCDVASSQEVFRQDTPQGNPMLAFSPDGKRLVVVSPVGEIGLWNAEKWTQFPVTFGGEPIPLLAVAFSPDGTKLLAGGGTFPPDKLYGQAAVWEVETGQRVVTVSHSAAVMHVEFAPDGEHFATSSLDTKCKLWELSSGEAVQTYRDPESGLVRMAFYPDGKQVATLGPTSGIKLFHRDATEPHTRLRFDGAYLTALGISPDGELIVSGGHDRVVRLWNAKTYQPMAVLRPGSDAESLRGAILAVACSPDEKLLALGREDGAIVLRRIDTGELIGVLQGHEDQVTSLVFAADGSLVSGSYDSTIRIWDVATGKVLKTLAGHDNWVMCVALSPDGKQIASGSYDRTVRTWDLAEGAELTCWTAHEASVRAVAFSPDGKQLLSGGSDRAARVWDRMTGKRILSFDAHKKAVRAARFSPDGGTIATASEDGRILLWNAKTGLDRRTLAGHSGMIWCLAFSADGKTLISGGDDRAVHVWDVSSLQQRQRLGGHADSVTSLATLTAKGTLVSTSLDGSIKLWTPENLAAKTTDAGQTDNGGEL